MPKRGRKASISDSDVYYACCALLDRHEIPSIDRVREVLGKSGSTNRVSVMIREQLGVISRDAKSATSTEIARNHSDLSLDQTMVEPAQALWESASSLAHSHFASVIRVLRNENEEMAAGKRQMLTQLNRLSEEKIVLEEKLSRAELDEHGNSKTLRIRELGEEVVRLQERCQKAESTNEWLQGLLTEHLTSARTENNSSDTPTAGDSESLQTVDQEARIAELTESLNKKDEEVQRLKSALSAIRTSAQGGGHGRKR